MFDGELVLTTGLKKPVHYNVTGMEEEGMGEIENGLRWFLACKEVWSLSCSIDKIR